MSDENDTSQDSWEEPVEDGDEAETQLRQKQQRASRDAYDDPSARQRQHPRQTGGSREAGKDKPGAYERRPGRRPGANRTNDPRQGYDAYGRPRHGTRSYRDAFEYTTEPPRERPRQTRDFHERPDPYDELDERTDTTQIPKFKSMIDEHIAHGHELKRHNCRSGDRGECGLHY